MKLLSEILSKRVLNVYSSKIEGVISSVVCHENKVVYLQFFDEDEVEFLLDTSKIYAMENDMIVIKNSACIMPASNITGTNRLMGIDVYNERGALLGQVEDVMLKDNFSISYIKVNGEEISIKKVLKINEVVMVKGKENISLFSFKPRDKKPVMPKMKSQSVKILPLEENVEEREDNVTLVEKLFPIKIKEETGYKISPSLSPQKVIGVGSGKYLIGRKATKTIYGMNNEILIRKDALVTDEILNKVRGHNKLMELALYTKEKKDKSVAK